MADARLDFLVKSICGIVGALNTNESGVQRAAEDSPETRDFLDDLRYMK